MMSLFALLLIIAPQNNIDIASDEQVQEDVILGQAKTSESTFELPIQAPKASLEKAQHYVKKGTVVFYIPNVRASTQEASYAEGPISQILVSRFGQSTLLRITPRVSVEVANSMLQLETEPSPVIRYGKKVEEDLSELAPPPKIEQSVDKQEEQKQEQPKKQSILKSKEKKENKNLKKYVSVITFALALIALGVWAIRKKQNIPNETTGKNIHVVAVKQIAPKQKLMLVDVGPERMLIASSDKDVRLIAHINVQPADVGLYPDDKNMSSDVEGILRMRQRHMDDVEDPLEYKPRKRGYERG